MSASPSERHVSVNGSKCRVWELGDGPVVGYLGGIRGVPRVTPFLELIARHHRVVVPSLPGHPGSEPGHRVLDDTIDWLAMCLDLLEAVDLRGRPVIGESIGATLALEVAAMSPADVDKLVAIAPFGLYADDAPVRNPYATHMPSIPAILSEDPQAYATAFGAGSHDLEVQAEHDLVLYRTDEATARYIWPFGDRGLAKRLHRVRCPTLILWGANDKILAPTYAEQFACAIAGTTETQVIAGAGHMVSIDAPKAVASSILGFMRMG